ncbi:spectrin beta chain, erythrocytic isoform X1 [Tachysurus ichikawai]
MTSTTDYDNADITQQYSRINTRFELSDEDLDNDNSTARLFERSRIKALAALFSVMELDSCPACPCPRLEAMRTCHCCYTCGIAALKQEP